MASAESRELHRVSRFGVAYQRRKRSSFFSRSINRRKIPSSGLRMTTNLKERIKRKSFLPSLCVRTFGFDRHDDAEKRARARMRWNAPVLSEFLFCRVSRSYRSRSSQSQWSRSTFLLWKRHLYVRIQFQFFLLSLGKQGNMLNVPRAQHRYGWNNCSARTLRVYLDQRPISRKVRLFTWITNISDWQNEVCERIWRWICASGEPVKVAARWVVRKSQVRQRSALRIAVDVHQRRGATQRFFKGITSAGSAIHHYFMTQPIGQQIAVGSGPKQRSLLKLRAKVTKKRGK